MHLGTLQRVVFPVVLPVVKIMCELHVLNFRGGIIHIRLRQGMLLCYATA